VDEKAYAEASWEELHALLNQVVSDEWVNFIKSFEKSILIGDYAFVHAGIRPGIPLNEQSVSDLRWIREPFLSSEQSHGCTVVHGHTIIPAPEFRRNRIGIDTGAYQSGQLTAILLEGAERALIFTTVEDGKIGISYSG
jgi:serine/threonine protein phosphatase 1